MPRTEGVSSRSTTCCMRRNPSPRMVWRMSPVQPMKLRTHLIFTVPPPAEDFFFDVMRSPVLPSRVFGLLGACLSHFAGILQVQQRRERSLDHVVRIGSADGLGQ